MSMNLGTMVAGGQNRLGRYTNQARPIPTPRGDQQESDGDGWSIWGTGDRVPGCVADSCLVCLVLSCPVLPYSVLHLHHLHILDDPGTWLEANTERE